MSKIKIIFIGTPEFGAIVLERLCKNNYKPVLVITAPDKPVGRKQILTPPPVKLTAIKYNILTEQPDSIKNCRFGSIVENLKPDLIVVASYGKIIPNKILDIPKYNCLNVHPSLLPRWRGPSPIQYTILNGDKKTGVTIIKMTEKVDAGPIISQRELNSFTGKETYQVLHDKLAKKGADLLLETIPRWIKGEIKPRSQDELRATYSKILKREDGLIDWRKPADFIDRQIRALNPEPGTYTFYRGMTLKILEAKVSDNKLLIEKVQLEGKKPMSFKDFLCGHPDFKLQNIC